MKKSAPWQGAQPDRVRRSRQAQHLDHRRQWPDREKIRQKALRTAADIRAGPPGLLQRRRREKMALQTTPRPRAQLPAPHHPSPAQARRLSDR